MVRVFNRQFFQSSVFFRSLFCLVSDLSNIVLQDLDYASMYDPRTCFTKARLATGSCTMEYKDLAK